MNSSSIFKGQIGRFLAQLRNKGSSEVEFRMDDTMFKEKFGSVPNVSNPNTAIYKFSTHSELDSFGQALLQIEPQFIEMYPEGN